MVTPKKVRRSATEWRRAFLVVLQQTGNVRLACGKAGISRKTAYKARDTYPAFRAQWEEVMDDAVDLLEAEARRRAMTTSDLLLIFLLKAHRPDKYRDTVRQEHSGPAGGPISFTILDLFRETGDDTPATTQGDTGA